jgi:uncharacterized protein YjbI with pentapeptide repeats
LGCATARADVFRWDTGEVIPDTEGIEPGPGIRLVGYCRDDRNLYFADLSDGLDLTRANFASSCLDHARLDDANLSNAILQETSLQNASLRGADLTGIFFEGTALSGADLTGAMIDRTRYTRTTGFTKEQLYSTGNYRQRDLRGLWFHGIDLRGWNFSGQNLTDTHLCFSDLTDANFANADLTDTRFSSFECKTGDLTNTDFSGAVVVGAWLSFATRAGFTKEQLYSTASWKQKNLRGIGLAANDLTGADFSQQDLSAANLRLATLTDANLSGAVLANASLGGALLSRADLTGANLKNAELPSSLETAIFDATTVYNQWTEFPEGFDPISAGLTYEPSFVGDFDPNDALDAMDIDLLTARLVGTGLGGGFDALFDINSDSVVDLADHRSWIKDFKKIWLGDANMDGEFNSSDLVQVSVAGKYEQAWEEWVSWPPGRTFIHNGAGWSEGDWNGDGIFDSSDMVTAFTDGGYDKGRRANAEAVPEPSGWLPLIATLCLCIVANRSLCAI